MTEGWGVGGTLLLLLPLPPLHPPPPAVRVDGVQLLLPIPPLPKGILLPLPRRPRLEPELDVRVVGTLLLLLRRPPPLELERAPEPGPNDEPKD